MVAGIGNLVVNANLIGKVLISGIGDYARRVASLHDMVRSVHFSGPS